MIKADTSKLKDSLEELKLKITRGLESVVEGFSYNIAVNAVDNTPFGELNGLYFIPSRTGAVPARVGAAKGGWVISFNRPTTAPFQEWADSKEAINIKNLLDQDSSKYKLGDTVFIQNRVPYVVQDHWSIPKIGNKEVLSLEHGYSDQAPNGIMSPTIEMITNVYSKNLQDYYEEQ